MYTYILINTQLRRLIESTLIKSNLESRRGRRANSRFKVEVEHRQLPPTDLNLSEPNLI